MTTSEIKVGKEPKERSGRPTVSEELQQEYIGKKFLIYNVPVSKGLDTVARVEVKDLKWRFGKLTAQVVGINSTIGEAWVEVSRLESSGVSPRGSGDVLLSVLPT